MDVITITYADTMQMVFLDVPCEFLLRNSWPGLDCEKLKLQVHNGDPTIEEYMNPLLKRHSKLKTCKQQN